MGAKVTMIYPHMLELLEKAIICIGPANIHLNNKVTICDKINGKFWKSTEVAKKKLKKMRSRKLLGRKFQSFMHRSLKRKREVRELKKSLFLSTDKKPFRGGPSTTSGQKYGEGQYRSPLAGLYDSRYERKNNQEKSSQESTQVNQMFGTNYASMVSFTNNNPTNKKGGGFGRKCKVAKGLNSSRDNKLRFWGPCRTNKIPKTRGQVGGGESKELGENNTRPRDIKIHFRGKN